jgi:protein-tyrosine phosphatase
MFSLSQRKESTKNPRTLSVLVVCTGNICRSPMAAGLLRHRSPESIKNLVAISSAGTSALHGNQAEPFAVRTMASIGVEIGDHRARQLDAGMLRGADLIVTMEQAHVVTIRRMLLLGKPQVNILGEFGPHPESPEIDDPYGGPLEAYRRCLDVISPCIDGLILKLKERIDKSVKEHDQ